MKQLRCQKCHELGAKIVQGRYAKDLRLCKECAAKYLPLEELEKFKDAKVYSLRFN